jgi:hypothetical protein
MHMFLSSYRSRGDVGPLAELPPRAAVLVTVQFETVAAAAEACDALVATALTPAGAWL